MGDTAGIWIERLELEPHPEGGHYRETYRADLSLPASVLGEGFDGSRRVSTAIYYLLRSGERSALHRLRSDEVWHHYAGAVLTLHVIHSEGRYEAIRLGTAIDSRERPQALVPAGAWFGATVDAPETWALVGCTVAPGFEFRDFERAERARLLRMFPPYREIIERLTQP